MSDIPIIETDLTRLGRFSYLHLGRFNIVDLNGVNIKPEVGMNVILTDDCLRINAVLDLYNNSWIAKVDELSIVHLRDSS